MMPVKNLFSCFGVNKTAAGGHPPLSKRDHRCFCMQHGFTQPKQKQYNVIRTFTQAFGDTLSPQKRLRTMHMQNPDSTKTISTSTTIEGFPRDQLVRLQLQFLQNNGYPETAAALERESGLKLEDDLVQHFRNAVLQGDWIATEKDMTALGFNEAQLNQGKFDIKKQEYLELLEKGKMQRALRLLQRELATMSETKSEEIFKLSALALVNDQSDLYLQSNWDGSQGKSRQCLLDHLQSLLYFSNALVYSLCRIYSPGKNATTEPTSYAA